MRDIRFLLLAAALFSGRSLSAADPVTPVRDAAVRWVEVEKALSREQAVGREKMARLTDLIRLAETEGKNLEEKIHATESASSAADQRRLELARENEGLDQKAAILGRFLKETEPRLLALRHRLPQPLREKLEPLYRRLPEASGQTGPGLAERMQTVVSLMDQIQKFDSVVTVHAEVLERETGSPVEIRTLHFGLGAAYYLSASGTDAGWGRMEEAGWRWISRPDLAATVREALSLAAGDSREARFLPLPVEVKQP